MSILSNWIILLHINRYPHMESSLRCNNLNMTTLSFLTMTSRILMSPILCYFDRSRKILSLKSRMGYQKYHLLRRNYVVSVMYRKKKQKKKTKKTKNKTKNKTKKKKTKTKQKQKKNKKKKQKKKQTICSIDYLTSITKIFCYNLSKHKDLITHGCSGQPLGITLHVNRLPSRRFTWNGKPYFCCC